MAVVVSDTSPIRALHHLDLLSLLPAQFGRIVVPTAVLHELENPYRTFSPIGADAIPFAEPQIPSNQSLLSGLRVRLGAGEAAAIALAVETPGRNS